MALKASYQSYKLLFRFNAGTSRGVLKERITYFIRLWDQNQPEQVAIGEAGPLLGLSPDCSDLEVNLQMLCQAINGNQVPQSYHEITEVVNKLVPWSQPSIRFSLETALYDLLSGAKKVLFPGLFTEGKYSMPINGLVWMGDYDFMKQQVDQKITAGYNCIKIKIGALDFKLECKLLEYIRNKYQQEISLRVDANGAFTPDDVRQKLEKLSTYGIHSIEQPIRSGQTKLLSELCLNMILPIALDEELIGITDSNEKEALLDMIRPQHIVLKPTLLGGMEVACMPTSVPRSGARDLPSSTIPPGSKAAGWRSPI